MRWLTILVAASACRSAPAPTPASRVASAPRAIEIRGEVKIVTETSVEILDPIKFLPGSATLEPTSLRMLDAVARTLTGNPSIKLVGVHAFGADALAAFQARLGVARAQVIVDELISRGVARTRLIAEGAAQPPRGSTNAPVFVILER